jgi:Ca2+/Na+ antiporter
MNCLRSQFGTKLTDEFYKAIEPFITQSKYIKFLNNMLLLGYILTLAIFLYFGRNSSFEKDMIKAITWLCMCGGYIILLDNMKKSAKDELDKSKQKIKGILIFNPCNCPSRCSCKDELRKHLKDRKMDILE